MSDQADADVLVSVRGLRTYFFDRRWWFEGLLGHEAEAVRAPGRHRSRHPPRRDGRPRRRVGLGKDDARQGNPPAGARHRRQGVLRRPGDHAAIRSAAPATASPHADDLPGPALEPEPPPARVLASHRAVPDQRRAGRRAALGRRAARDGGTLDRAGRSTPTSSQGDRPAGSGSRGRSPSTPSSSSRTSRPRVSTSRWRPRS